MTTAPVIPAALKARLMNYGDLLSVLLRQSSAGLRIQTYHEGNFVVALAPAATFVNIVSFQLPIGMQGQIEAFTFGCEVLSDFDVVTWQVKIDGAPVPQFDNIQGPQSTFVFPKVLATPIPVRAGALIAVAAKTSVLTLGNIAAVCMGSFWPQQGPDVQVDPTGHVTAQL